MDRQILLYIQIMSGISIPCHVVQDITLTSDKRQLFDVPIPVVLFQTVLVIEWYSRLTQGFMSSSHESVLSAKRTIFRLPATGYFLSVQAVPCSNGLRIIRLKIKCLVVFNNCWDCFVVKRLIAFSEFQTNFASDFAESFRTKYVLHGLPAYDTYF